MNEYDDEDSGFHESEETDPIIRELRSEIVRLEAQIDQLAASMRERAEEQAAIRAKLLELEQAIARLEARRRRDVWLIWLAWALMLISLTTSVYTYLTT
jgi:septal ring factor EnvC (AmiA/AmiB activator)